MSGLAWVGSRVHAPPASGPVRAFIARPNAAKRLPVPLCRMMLRPPLRARLMARPMLVGRRSKLLLHQRSAAAVPHDLAIGHGMALADRLLREMQRLVPMHATVR